MATLAPSTLNVFQAVRQGDIETVRYLVSLLFYVQSIWTIILVAGVKRQMSRLGTPRIACHVCIACNDSA